MAELTEKVLAAVRDGALLVAGDSLLIAFSGGADSMALTDVLLALREQLGIGRLAAAHLNHCLRGSESDGDEQTVRRFCAERELPLFVQRVDVAAEAARTKRGIEETARTVRYAFLRETAAREGFSKIATAHTASDNTETVLLHLARGTGLEGLCGIRPVNGPVIRPLLGCSRAEVERYCATQELTFVNDSSNADVSYARNRIRMQVTPSLRKLNPRLDESVGRMVRQLQAVSAFLHEMAEQALAEARISTGRYRCAVFRDLPEAVGSAALRMAFAESGGETLEERHTIRLLRLLEKNGSLDLPGGIRAMSSAGVLAFDREAPTAASDGICVLSPGDSYGYCGRKYRCELVYLDKWENNQKVHKNLLKNAMDYDKICGSIRMRSRMAGDAYHPVGRGCGKTLKKLFQEAAIPAFARASIPVLVDDNGIVLVAGFGCDRRVAPDADTRRLLLFGEYERTGETN